MPRMMRWLESYWQDLKYALRGLSLNRGFTAVTVVSLALGIGANTGIFSVLDAVLWKMLPVEEPQELVFLDRHDGRQTPFSPGGKFRKFCDISYDLMREFDRRSSVVTGVTTFQGGPMIASIRGELEPVSTLRVDDNFYSVVGVRPHAGRLIQAGDMESGNIVVLSYAYWQRRFGGEPVVGNSISLDGTVYTIGGIAPPEFFGVVPGHGFDISVPLIERELRSTGPPPADPRSGRLFFVIARLKRKVGTEEAGRSLSVLLRQMMHEQRVVLGAGNLIDQHWIEATPASHGLASLRAQYSKPLVAVMTLVFIVLLITCANVANLLLARATVRQKEMAIRASIGAGRQRLVRQLMTESMVLGLAGGTAGLLLAYWTKEGLLALVSIGRAEPIPLDVSLDHRALLFTFAVSIGTGLLYGLAPAWRASGASWTGLGSRTADRRPSNLSKVLVAVEVALSIVLLAGAALFVRSFQNLTTLDAGFHRDHVLMVSINPTLAGMQQTQNRMLYTRVAEGIMALPGVVSASYSRMSPLGGGSSLSGMAPPAYVSPPGEGGPLTYFQSVGPRYFETLGMRVVAGRDFRVEDNEDAPKVIAINEAAARKYFPGQDPIGQRMGHEENRSEFEVIAVVSDARTTNLREPAEVTAYLPVLQAGEARDTVLQIRTTGEPLQLATMIRQVVREVNAAVPVMSVSTLDEWTDRSLALERLVATLATLFGVLALVLASVGLAGVLWFNVARRKNEIGIRMALGAQQGHVIWLVFRESLALVVAGMLVGLPCAIAAAAAARSLLFGLNPADPASLGVAVVVLGLVTLTATYGPARRAARISPMEALRM